MVVSFSIGSVVHSIILFWIVCCLYLLGWLLCAFSFFRDWARLHRSGEFILLSGLAVHLPYAGFRFFRPQFSPFYTVAGLLLVLSLLVAIVYFLLDYLYRKEIFEIVFPPLAVFFLILSNLPIHQSVVDSQFINESTNLYKAMLFSHAFCSMLGYLLFGVACFPSIFFLSQEKKIKTKRLLLADAKVPSLGFLDRLNHRILSSGFLFLSVGLLVGTGMKLTAGDGYEGVTLRQVIPFCTWLFYALFLFDRFLRGLQGKVTAIMAIFGFSAALLSFLYEMLVLTA